MKRFFLFILVLTAFVSCGEEEKQKFNGQITQFGSNEDDSGNSVAFDNDGNIFITGTVGASVEGNTYFGGLTDIFLSKFDKNGIKLWTKQFGTDDSDENNQLVIDNSGNIYISGSTLGTWETNEHIGSYNSDIFLMKLDNNGNKIWIRQFGTTRNDKNFAITLDSDNNIFLTGYTQGEFLGNTCEKDNYGSCSYDIYFSKFNNDGVEIFTKQFGSSKSDFGNSIAVDNNGNIFITGETQGDLKANSYQGTCSDGYFCSGDIFLIKFDNTGTSKWTKQWGSNTDSNGTQIKIDSNQNIIMSYIKNVTDSDNSYMTTPNVFLSKFDNEGNELWTNETDTFYGDNSFDINENNEIYLILNEVSLDDSYGLECIRDSNGSCNGDIFLIKFDNNGSQKSAKIFGTTKRDYSSSVKVNNNTVIITGKTNGNFDNNQCVKNTENICSEDIFLIKYNE